MQFICVKDLVRHTLVFSLSAISRRLQRVKNQGGGGGSLPQWDRRTPATASIAAAATISLHATGSYSDGTTKDSHVVGHLDLVRFERRLCRTLA